MAFVRPGEIIKYLGILPGMKVADFGAGSGYYSLAAAKLVGASGKVYSIDIQKDLLSNIKSTAELDHLQNIEIVWSDLEKEEGSRLDKEIVNFVIISNILFQVENKEAIIKEALRILKPNGRVIVIEWSKEQGIIGPPTEKRIGKEECTNLLSSAGFKFDKEFNAGDNHYGMVFIK